MRIDMWLAVLVIPVGLAITGCGSSRPHNAGPSAAAIRSDFRGSPPALAAVHAQADQLLDGGPPAFRARLRSLRGHPVVVNLWASWCVPCQSEFPMFQDVAASDGRHVAFLGVDVADGRTGAASFLKRFPLTYPSYFDPHKSIEAALLTLQATPQTFYFDAAGREQYDHGGSYASAAALRRDIHTYLGVS